MHIIINNTTITNVYLLKPVQFNFTATQY